LPSVEGHPASSDARRVTIGLMARPPGSIGSRGRSEGFGYIGYHLRRTPTDIVSSRIRLVALREGHADDLVGLLAEPLLQHWLRAENVDELRERFKSWEAGCAPDGTERWLNWIVLAHGEGVDRPLGWVQATVRDQNATIAYAVLPDERGRGVAGAAVTLMAQWLVSECCVASVEAEIDPGNTRSEAVAAKAGFIRTDRVRDGETVWILVR
jgi:RimJ/RimL family protein N-acetyltransferase